MFCISLSFCLQAQTDTLSLAKNLYEQGQYKKTSDLLIDWVSKAKTSIPKADALVLLSKSEERLSQLQTALNYSLQATEECEKKRYNQGFGYAHLQAAKVYEKMNLFRMAYSHASAAQAFIESDVDTEIDLLRLLAYCAVQNDQPQKALPYYEKLAELSKKDSKEYASALKDLSSAYTLVNNYLAAIKALQTRIEILHIQQDSIQLAQSYRTLGALHQKQGELTQSLQALNKAIEYQKKLVINDALTYETLGATLLAQKQRDAALKAFKTALDLQQNNPSGMANCYNLLAVCENYFMQFDNAIVYAQKAIEFGELAQNPSTLSDSYQILSETYARISDLRLSQQSLTKHLEFKKIVEEKRREAQKLELEKNFAAERRENEYLSFVGEKERQELKFKQLQLEKDIKEQDLALLKSEKELQKTQLANQELEKSRTEQELILAKNQLIAAQRQRAIEKLERETELQKLAFQQQEYIRSEKEKELALISTQADLLKKEKALSDSEKQIAKERLKYLFWLIILGILLFIMALVGLFWFRKQSRSLAKSQRLIQQKNIELINSEEELRQLTQELLATNTNMSQTQQELQILLKDISKKNRDITSSIAYAQRIQAAILPDTTFGDWFEDSFVLFRPRDIVSGDFYWISNFDPNKIMFAVADCTGHGVPGAFMSLIGTSELNTLAGREKEPQTILEGMSKYIRNSLKQNQNQNRDGMTIGLCVWNKNEKTLEFAGSRTPFIYIQHGELHEIKGDTNSIGGDFVRNDFLGFTKHTIKVDVPTTIYLYSDGFQDQIGGHEKKKFSGKNLRALLHQIHQIPKKKQKTILENTLQQWMDVGNERQLDDILVMGVRIGG